MNWKFVCLCWSLLAVDDGPVFRHQWKWFEESCKIQELGVSVKVCLYSSRRDYLNLWSTQNSYDIFTFRLSHQVSMHQQMKRWSKNTLSCLAGWPGSTLLIETLTSRFSSYRYTVHVFPDTVLTTPFLSINWGSLAQKLIKMSVNHVYFCFCGFLA